MTNCSFCGDPPLFITEQSLITAPLARPERGTILATARILFPGIVQTQTQFPSTRLYSRREFNFLRRGCIPSCVQKSWDRLHFDYPYEKECIRFAIQEFSAVATRMHTFLSDRVVGRHRGGWLVRALQWPVERRASRDNHFPSSTLTLLEK